MGGNLGWGGFRAIPGALQLLLRREATDGDAENFFLEKRAF
jgi:hypothetical protein